MARKVHRAKSFSYDLLADWRPYVVPPDQTRVHPASDGFTVYDTDAGEAIIKFSSRAEVDEMIAALQIAEVHAKLQRWALDAFSRTY